MQDNKWHNQWSIQPKCGKFPEPTIKHGVFKQGFVEMKTRSVLSKLICDIRQRTLEIRWCLVSLVLVTMNYTCMHWQLYRSYACRMRRNVFFMSKDMSTQPGHDQINGGIALSPKYIWSHLKKWKDSLLNLLPKNFQIKFAPKGSKIHRIGTYEYTFCDVELFEAFMIFALY